MRAFGVIGGGALVGSLGTVGALSSLPAVSASSLALLGLGKFSKGLEIETKTIFSNEV